MQGPAPQPQAAASARTPGTILLVEETHSLAEVYRQYLRAEPWPMRHATSMAAAKAVLASQDIDLVLLDLRMPDGDGMDLLRHIGTAAGTPAVVVITAHGSVAAGVAAMREGAIDFLLKPFAAARLVATVGLALDHMRLRHAVARLSAMAPQPPLCQRGADVLKLARALLARFGAEQGRAFQGFTPDAEALLLAYRWPGDVAELEHAIRTTVLLNDAALVTARMLPASVQASGRAAASRAMAFTAPTPAAASGIRTLDALEQDAVHNAIALCDGNVPRAAAHLGVSPSTLYRKLKRWETGAGS